MSSVDTLQIAKKENLDNLKTEVDERDVNVKK